MSKHKGKTLRDTRNIILESLKLLKTDVSDLYLPKDVEVLNEIPQPLEFHQKWVAPNIPVLIKGGIKTWPALKKWTPEYFCSEFGDKKITVAVTPNGYADAITQRESNDKTEELFVLPEERIMTVRDFFRKLDHDSNLSEIKDSTGVFYLQKQNSNLTEEFPELLNDIDKTLSWASKTFGSEPVAINLWIGDERAVTSLHKDPFENIYCVISGSKEFILYPPSDRPWLTHKKVPVGQYKETKPGFFEVSSFDTGKWKFKVYEDDDDDDDISLLSQLSFGPDLEPNEAPWIAIDPARPDYTKYPLYKNASPIRVKVEAGDLLYLPSLWFHYVTQSHKTIAINYWYDMKMDIKYAYFQLLDNLTKFCNEFII